MYSIKITHNGEVRRMAVSLNGTVATAYEQLVQTVRNLFPDLQMNRSFCLTWQDDEGDVVTVSSELELTEAIRVMTTMYGGNSLRFGVKKLEKPAASAGETSAGASTAGPFVRGGDKVAADMKRESEEVIHYGVQCDECGMSPIVGIRYKCTVRHNFDLCSGCHDKRTQPHPMVAFEEPVYGRHGCRRNGGGKGRKCERFDMPPPPHGPPHHHLHGGHHGHHGHGHGHRHGGGRGGRGGGGMFHWFGGLPGEGIPYESCEDYYGPFSDPSTGAAGPEDKKGSGEPTPLPHPHPPRHGPFGGPHGGPHPHPPMPPHGGIFGGRGGRGGGGPGCPFGGRGGRGWPFGAPLVVEAEIYPATATAAAAAPPTAAAKEGTTAAAPEAPQSEGSVVHVGVTCDVCGVSPITGPRYKCTVRDNFDVCAACYESELQPYPMLKIVTNGGVGTVVTPAAAITRDLNDEDAGLQAAISASYASAASTTAATAAAPVPAAEVPPPLLRSTISETSATVDDEDVEDVYSDSFTFVEKVNTPPPTAAAATAPSAAAPITSPAAAAAEEDTEALFAEAAATAERVHQALLWERELKLLGDMGFTDTEVLIPLLQQHVGTPAGSGHPATAVEGMQQVVAALLLGQSGIRR